MKAFETTTVLTYWVGHLVMAERPRDAGPNRPVRYTFLAHWPSGDHKLLLDAGQDWSITRGETFPVAGGWRLQEDRALEELPKTMARGNWSPAYKEAQP